jgi:CRP/FNR family transcriptional regulator
MGHAALRVEELQGVDKIWHLRQATMLKGLSIRDLTVVAGICQDRIYSKGEVIFHQEDPADSLFILNRGCVRVAVISPVGREKTVGLFQTGDVFGENVLIDEGRRKVQATAHLECWVSVIGRDHLLQILAQKPGLALSLMQILTLKLSQSRDEISALSFLDTERRVARTLLQLGRLHGKEIVTPRGMVKLKIPLSHEQLARMIGGNRPHISTIMSKFKKSGWIGYQGRKLLVDLRALSHLTVHPEPV